MSHEYFYDYLISSDFYVKFRNVEYFTYEIISDWENNYFPMHGVFGNTTPPMREKLLMYFFRFKNKSVQSFGYINH